MQANSALDNRQRDEAYAQRRTAKSRVTTGQFVTFLTLLYVPITENPEESDFELVAPAN